MDEFRKKPRGRSVDGFVSGRQPYLRGSQDLRGFDQYHHTKKPGTPPTFVIPKIDNFNSLDGFTPSVQPMINTPADTRKPADFSLTFDKPFSQHTSQRPNFDAPKDHPKPKKRLLGRLFKAKHKHGRKNRRMALRLSAGFAVLLLLVGGGLVLRAFLTGRNIFKGGGNSALLNNQDVDPTQLKGEGDGRVNIMILGKGGSEQRDGPDLTDTIIIASIDPIAKEAALLSIPRDLWVKSPTGYESKINEVYANAKYATLDDYPFKDRNSDEAKEKAEKAGVEALKNVLSKSLGVPIHYHTMIDFAGFRKAIDTVGGIDINVTQDMAVKETLWLAEKGTYQLNAQPGWQHFDGWKALAFSRSRKTSTRGDFSRAERQRAVILALKDKVLSTGTLANPIKINQLISDFGEQVSTDFSINEILRVYDLAKEIPGDKVVSVGLDDYVHGDMINSLSVQVPKAGLFDFSEIQNYVRNVMRDAFLKKEDAKIMILNGTDTAGLATKKSTELKSYGYNILSVGDAPTKAYTKTILVDLRNGTNKYTLSYLEKRLNLKASTSLPDASINAGAADFVLILGTDQVGN